MEMVTVLIIMEKGPDLKVPSGTGCCLLGLFPATSFSKLNPELPLTIKVGGHGLESHFSNAHQIHEENSSESPIHSLAWMFLLLQTGLNAPQLA